MRSCVTWVFLYSMKKTDVTTCSGSSLCKEYSGLCMVQTGHSSLKRKTPFQCARVRGSIMGWACGDTSDPELGDQEMLWKEPMRAAHVRHKAKCVWANKEKLLCTSACLRHSCSELQGFVYVSHQLCEFGMFFFNNDKKLTIICASSA